MPDAGTAARLWIAAALLAAGPLAFDQLSHGEAVAPRIPLVRFPVSIAGWSSRDVALPDRIVGVLGVDEYLNRTYVGPGGNWISLFVSYYRSQRTGQTIHSPKNCLPAAGWVALDSRRLAITMPPRAPLVVNEYDVARESDRSVVLYWYQERGHSMASEYEAKWRLTVDAITRNRTDGALVRVVTPVAGDRARAERRAVNFVRAIFPRLGNFIPN